MIRSASLACLLMLLVFAPGCAAVVAGAAAAGTVQYVRNEAARDYDATVDATWSATLGSLRDQGYPVDPSASYAGRGGALEVNDVKVWVGSLGPAKSRVRIRVGTFDTDKHRNQAHRILDGISAHLGS